MSLSKLRHGEDCAGISGSGAALKEIFKDGRTIRHVFASEKCPFTAAILQASSNIDTFFDDVTTRDHSKLECVDVYAAGAPCQPFSMNGKQRGLFDSRSHVILCILETIDAVRPNIFVLEQVATFLTRNQKLCNIVLKFLGGIKDAAGRAIYGIHFRVLDSFHNGLPQQRRRLYIVGIKKIKLTRGLHFEWPCEMHPVSLDDFLLPPSLERWPVFPATAIAIERMLMIYQRMERDNVDYVAQTVLLDAHASSHWGKNYFVGICPTLTRARAGADGFYLSRHLRFMKTSEMLRLQGFKTNVVKFKKLKYNTRRRGEKNVTRRQLQLGVGNAMSVPVVGRVLFQCLKVTGFLSGDAVDPWYPRQG